MIKCPNCKTDLKHYATKKKYNSKQIRYYHCNKCDEKFSTVLTETIRGNKRTKNTKEDTYER